MSVPYTKCGKEGNTIWQRNRYGKISYHYHIHVNTKSPAQTFVRGWFGVVAARWRTITEEQRVAWCRMGKSKKTRRRLGLSYPMRGYNYYVQVNVLLVNRGLDPVDWPPVEDLEPKLALPLLTDKLFRQPKGALPLIAPELPETAGPAPPPGG